MRLQVVQTTTLLRFNCSVRTSVTYARNTSLSVAPPTTAAANGPLNRTAPIMVERSSDRRTVRPQTLTLVAFATQARHVGLGSGFVEEHQLLQVDAGQLTVPAVATFFHIRTELLGRRVRLFCNAVPASSFTRRPRRSIRPHSGLAATPPAWRRGGGHQFGQLLPQFRRELSLRPGIACQRFERAAFPQVLLDPPHRRLAQPDRPAISLVFLPSA